MTLRSQLLNRLKEEGIWCAGANLERVEFITRKGGLYKPSTVSRCLRELAEITGENNVRVIKCYENRTVFYHYVMSSYEEYDNKVQQGQLI